ncbi:Multifunctional conjugation protein TraI [Marinomonas gallaica]|uniref:Multifunctional conjugation protein TraI n=1 Tax=Marinomonas gallaica TaxID=1806667 RepID=A0A1C3JR56_9GAMM|nr:MobF family relaxase [Marinomonas gallaica]SBT17708.1 Multifunctional conjugation protein TraI [Marinomonas gallaica]SBT20034.1 Multifunctional conjugation protein TraI [Marinomonas gallaica]
MMSPFAIKSPEHAATYYEQSEHADYYAKDEVCPAKWEGKAAELLGIQGQSVEKDRFKRHLNGEIAGQKLGTFRAGHRVHKPAFDLTFSPPKSVTVAAIVGEDPRVKLAHEDAVKEALSHVEEMAIFKRKHTIEETGKSVIEQIKTGNLLAAVFMHESARSVDGEITPQLHSHAVVMNATHDEDGKWKSLESRHIWCLQKKIGLFYRQQLAANLAKLGYEIDRKAEGNFEISGVPQEVCDAFSLRKGLIDSELGKRGYTRESAPAYLKEQLAHRIREKKVNVNRDELKQQWKNTENDFGFDSEKLAELSVKRCEEHGFNDVRLDRNFENLNKITEQAILKLSEREAVFSKDELSHEINLQAVGYGISPRQVNNRLKILEDSGDLISRETEIYSSQFQQRRTVEAYTTPALIQLEEELIEILTETSSKYQRVFSEKAIECFIYEAVQESLSMGYNGWNAEQKSVTRGLLASKNQITGLSGYAGTAKTSTVLKTISHAYSMQGYEVIGMAPSSSACESLKSGAGLGSTRTVASHLLRSAFQGAGLKKQLWLVDEASLLSSKDTLKLFKQAMKQDAKIILVGDAKQLGSVEAGAAFRQLQEAGMQTHRLTEIVRQENKHALDAVYSSIDADTRKALNILTQGAGEVITAAERPEERYKHITSKFLSLPKDERSKTLIIDPSRESRQALTDTLREELKQSGDISINAVIARRLEKVDITKSAQNDVLSFSEGMVIKFGRDYKLHDVKKDSYWSVREVNAKNNTLTLQDDSGRELIWNPAGTWGKRMQSYTEVHSELCAGDEIIWTQNDKALKLANGMAGQVVSVDGENNQATVEFKDGKQFVINTNEQMHQHWNHNFVTTAHAAQGMTSERVIYHAESFRKNLASQKSFYVALSRAKQEVVVVTDNQRELINQINAHTGEKQNALEIDSQKERGVEYEF